MIQTKEEMFLAEMGIHTQTIIEGDYTAKYKLKDLLKKYTEQCNIAYVVGQSEQLFCDRCKKLQFMIDNGLDWKDMENDNKPRN